MALLVATIASLALAAPAAPPRTQAPRTPAARAQLARAPQASDALDELPKAPVEIVLPPPAKGSRTVKPSPSATVSSPPVVSAAPALQAQPPSTPPAAPASAAAPSGMPTDAEILAAATGELADSRAGYALVEQKCGRCHGMDKALEAGFEPGDWAPYLKRKLRRHGAGISEEQAAEIGRFLSDWSAQRAAR